MPQKKSFEQAAWSWMNSVDSAVISDVTEDHLNSVYRRGHNLCQQTCRRNCRGNPFCLSNLGESKWLGTIDDKYEEEPDLLMRQPDTFVGLKNLGNTCYANVLLQLWFHDLAFRRAIYLWNPEEADSLEPVGDASASNEANESKSIVRHLQKLFALMQFGIRRSVDPTDFIKALDVDPHVQQDAQEFLKLLINHLEESLAGQSNPSVRLLTQKFQGEYSYITRCFNCQQESVRPEVFHELTLPIEGNKTLKESLNEFLKEEKLEGSEMYSCQICNNKQEALRFIRLNKLPPVLQLHLLRFVFDRQRNLKKKLHCSFQFPETLDLSEYMTLTEPAVHPIIYQLTAVLVHKGLGAYSGHFLAFIRDQLAGHWYKFSDEAVEKLEGNKLNLGACEDDVATSRPKKRRVQGFLDSSNAYMLVYTAVESQQVIDPITEEELPGYLKEEVKQSNDFFQSILNETLQQKKMEKEEEQALQSRMMKILTDLPLKSLSEPWEAISTNWLQSWLNHRNKSGPPPQITNDKIVCPHDKLNPKCLNTNAVKYINKKGADSLFEAYGGQPRLSGESCMCKECVIQEFKIKKIREILARDTTTVNNLLKKVIDPEQPSYWVSKIETKNWRKKAVEMHLDKNSAVEDLLGQSDYEASNDEVSTIANPPKKRQLRQWTVEALLERKIVNETKFHQSKIERVGGNNQVVALYSPGNKRRNNSTSEGGDDSKEEECDDEIPTEHFNEDIRCPHGKLSVQSARKLVSPEVWAIFKKYFPTAIEFTNSSIPCEVCQAAAFQNEEQLNLGRDEAAREKDQLSSLLLNKGRPKFTDGTFHLVSIPDFLLPLRAFVRTRGKSPKPFSMRNATLICLHGLLTRDPASETDSASMAPVTDEEWEALMTFHDVDAEITITYGPDGSVLSTSPDICSECWEIRMQSEFEARLQYKGAKLYIRRVAPEWTASSEDSDPSNVEAQQGKPWGKRQLCAGDAPSITEIRRSARTKRVRGDQIVTADSESTVGELKLKILHTFSVSPVDQELYTEDNRYLCDSGATLASLNIVPDTVLLLKVIEQPKDEDIFTKMDQQIEEGFKGTALARR